MTQHDPNAFDQALTPALHVPATRLLAICRQLLPAYERRHTIPVLGLSQGRGDNHEDDEDGQ